MIIKVFPNTFIYTSFDCTMDTKFKRHQKVRLLRAPLIDDVEPYADPPKDIVAGMAGKINLILPNGNYHVDIIDKNGETIAYCAIDEEGLEALETPEETLERTHHTHPDSSEPGDEEVF